MKKITFVLFLLVNISGILPAAAYNKTFQVKPEDIYAGYVVQKIWLNEYVLPQITLSDISYTANVALPGNAKVADPNKYQAVIGMDRKKPFLVVRIPAYVAGAKEGQVNQVASFTISFNENPVADINPAAKTTDVTTSVLASGTIYKIGITNTGFYKIDNAFITAMGLSPSNINPANIRIFGNGGRMLSENNAVPRSTDLVENPTILNSNGDNVFDNGEYAVFYATGPTGWDKDSLNQRFIHVKNIYTDTAYYFISFDKGAGIHIAQQAAISGGNVNVTSFNYYDVHDSDMVNPPGLGKLWVGEQFSSQLSNTTQNFTFNLGTPVDNVYCTVSFATTSSVANSKYTVSLNSNPAIVDQFLFPATADVKMYLKSKSENIPCGSSVANIGITYTPSDAGGAGYLNYIELNARRNLIMTGDQMNFRDWQSVGAGNIANYQLQGANSNTRVWDVTNPLAPVLMNGVLSGSTYSFTQDAAMLHEFAAMNSTNLYTPKYIGKVDNQNLHGSPQVDLIIVTHADFLSQAQQLADHHRQHDGLRVIVATTAQVYNEFSSGGQDISGIRDFARMFYKRAGTDTTQMPRSLLLFGGASYDYKNRITNNCNYVPVFESAESLNDLTSFSSDDFYGFLDDSEYIENTSLLNVLDVGVGRLPARNVDDATKLVNKIINYTKPATLGPWRLSATIVADRECHGNGAFDPAGHHMSEDGEGMAEVIRATGKNRHNIEKVYLDAMPVVSTPAGPRCPNASAAINEQVFKGTFMINYNGHGNPQVWSGERILTQDDFNNWNNANMLPFMVTATCDFGQFDHPQFVSAAEQLVLRKGGGVIAMLTTTQAVYAFYNHKINRQYLLDQFSASSNNKWKTFGDANRTGKNMTFMVSNDYNELANFRKFALLGDPALTPSFPEYNISIDEVTDGYTLQPADTIKALGAYVISGSVRDQNGNVLTGFTNGLLSVSFYDKPRTINTISGCNTSYKVQNNIVYKGKVSVINGKFSFTFITPKDINYYFGTGKISTYAENGTTDAAGADTAVKVGGFSDHPVISTEPPVVKPYINDSLFLNGGITGSNTSLFVSFYSKTGINVSGNDIGHDLTAVVDGNVETPYVLNDYYETAPNTYQRGYVSFPVTGLADGRHSITVQAWDVNNNTGEGTVDFIVVNGKVMDIQQLGNYPNPFSNTTNFVFEHNHPYEELSVQINIYNTSGSLVKSIDQKFTPSGSRSSEITWDGTDNNGSRLSSGMYVYRLNISTDKGYKSSAYQKLVIVR